MKRLFAGDLVLLGYLGAVTAVVLAARPEGLWIYLGVHALAVALIAVLVHVHARLGGRFWTFLRYWYVVPFGFAAFRELHYLIPRVHPFADRRFDGILAALDRKWFGDVESLLLPISHPVLIDALHLFYWFYFASMLILPGILYGRGELDHVREYVAVLFTGLCLSYLGYFAVPAVGPHHAYTTRPPELDGWLIGRPLHRAYVALEGEMADAFPSGHALASMIVLVISWRHARRTFWALLVPALGCVAATVILRYHYVVDVLAATALLPVAAAGGTALHRWWERVRLPAGEGR
jgi:hypothetical protein